jgi:hypothetical protein
MAASVCDQSTRVRRQSASNPALRRSIISVAEYASWKVTCGSPVEGEVFGVVIFNLLQPAVLSGIAPTLFERVEDRLTWNIRVETLSDL